MLILWIILSGIPIPKDVEAYVARMREIRPQAVKIAQEEVHSLEDQIYALRKKGKSGDEIRELKPKLEAAKKRLERLASGEDYPDVTVSFAEPSNGIGFLAHNMVVFQVINDDGFLAKWGQKIVLVICKDHHLTDDFVGTFNGVLRYEPDIAQYRTVLGASKTVPTYIVVANRAEWMDAVTKEIEKQTKEGNPLEEIEINDGKRKRAKVRP